MRKKLALIFTMGALSLLAFNVFASTGEEVITEQSAEASVIENNTNRGNDDYYRTNTNDLNCYWDCPNGGECADEGLCLENEECLESGCYENGCGSGYGQDNARCEDNRANRETSMRRRRGC